MLMIAADFVHGDSWKRKERLHSPSSPNSLCHFGFKPCRKTTALKIDKPSLAHHYMVTREAASPQAYGVTGGSGNLCDFIGRVTTGGRWHDGTLTVYSFTRKDATQLC